MRKKFLWEEIQESLNRIESNLKLSSLSSDDKDLELRKSLLIQEIYEVIRFVGTSTDKAKIKFNIWLNRNMTYRQSAKLLDVAEGSVKTLIRDYDGRLRSLISISNDGKGNKGTIDRINNCKTLSELEAVKADFWQKIKSLKGSYFRK